MVRSRLSTISVGEYISSTMINFLSESLQDKHSTFTSAMFRSKGIICEFSKSGQYSKELEVSAGDGSLLKIAQGSFITPLGKVVNVPQTQLDIQVSEQTNILIKYEEQTLIPEATASGLEGGFTISLSNAVANKLIVPGMKLLLESDMLAGERSGFEITSVGSVLTLKDPLPSDIVNERFTIIPRFSSSVFLDENAFCYRFDSFKIVSTAQNPGIAFDSSWILLATIRLVDETYIISNPRIPYYGSVPENESEIRNWLPNVASIRSAYDTTIEQSINQLFSVGELTVDDVTKNIFNLAHSQNTDSGTNKNRFDINTSKGIFRLGDNDNASFLYRLFSDTNSKVSYELPTGQQSESTITLSATNVSQTLTSTKAFK